MLRPERAWGPRAVKASRAPIHHGGRRGRERQEKVSPLPSAGRLLPPAPPPAAGGSRAGLRVPGGRLFVSASLPSPLSPPASPAELPTVHVAILSWGVGDASKVLSGAGGRGPGAGPCSPPFPAARASHRPPYPPQTPRLPRAVLRVEFPQPENPGKRNEPQLDRRHLHPSFRSFPPPSSPVPLKTRPRGGPCTPVLASVWVRGPWFPT